jgi:hypothetical protein
MENSAAVNGQITPSLTQQLAIPDEIRVIKAGEGTIELELVHCDVHGTKVYSTSDTTGSGGAFPGQGVSIVTDINRYREFWARPRNGGKDIFFKLSEDGFDFGVADGQEVAVLFAKGKVRNEQPLGIVNLSSQEALRMNNGVLTKVGDAIGNDLVKPTATLFDGFLFSVAFLAACGIPIWLGISHRSWMYGAISFGVLFGIFSVCERRIGPLKRTSEDTAAREVVSKKVRNGVAALIAWTERIMQIKWQIQEEPDIHSSRN